MNQTLRFSALSLLVSMCVAGMAIPAEAYERTMTCEPFGQQACEQGQEPKPIFWPNRCVQYRINESGSSKWPGASGGTISDDLRQIVVESFETWNAPTCTDFSMVEGELTSATRAEYDPNKSWDENANLIVWRDDQWKNKSRAAFAVTSVSYRSSGKIADADIEINSLHHEFDYFETSKVGQTNKIDIGNTLTHEVGHFLGLAHPSDKPESTMWREAPEGEIKKRSLEEDDIQGLCAIYPGTERGGAACSYPDDFVPPSAEQRTEASGCGCAAADPDSFPLPGLALVLVIGAALARRRLSYAETTDEN